MNRTLNTTNSRSNNANSVKKAKKSKSFKVSLVLSVTDASKKIFSVRNVESSMTVKDLRSNIELISGIPYHLQRLHYIDDGELSESMSLATYDIVPNAQLKLKLWLMWESLISAIITGTADQVFALGVTADSDYETPRIAYLTDPEDRQSCLAERAAVALFVAACHGRQDICSRLIQSGACVNWATRTTERTPLHVAAANGHINIVNLLLEKGADIKAVDADGQTAIMLAGQFGHKACERQLVQFTWQQRAALNRPHGPPPPLLPHQRFDSALPASLADGPEAQVYRPQLVPSGEFGGTGFDAPRRKVKAPGTGHSGHSGRRTQSCSTSAPTTPQSVQFPYYNYNSSSDWLALISDEAEVGPADEELKASSPTQQRRHLVNDSDDLIEAVIQRKMQQQRELGLGGLPYDLWLAIADRPELFQALKEQGKLDSVLSD